jgi:hypothetical protein
VDVWAGPRVTVGGVRVHVAPAGVAVTDSDTVPVNPLTGVMVIGMSQAEPTGAVQDAAPAVTVKSFTVTVTVAE